MLTLAGYSEFHDAAENKWTGNPWKNKMIIKHNGNIHKICRITGNQHNFLEIILSEIYKPIKINILNIKKEEGIINISPEEVSFYVTKGVNLIYDKYKLKFFISEISFCQSDSQPSNIYAFLTFHLLEDIIKNENKVEIHYIENIKTGEKTDFKFKD